MPLQFQPGQKSVRYNITIVNNVKEEGDETFALQLDECQRRVSIADGFGESVVTIVEELCK